MDSIKVKTSAKINLSLDVVGRKPDGYHLIESIFQSVNIYDIITVSKTENGIHLTCNEPEIPCDSRNIAYKAARLFLDKTGIKSGINIHIEKTYTVSGRTWRRQLRRCRRSLCNEHTV